jgi:VIT1/CCC1 family predicted Fe2+/Mn2+ transporter
VRSRHTERHRTHHVGWLRAAVLGANDGIVSTASLVMGVAAAQGDRHAILLAGVAGLVAGAMSMAAGEYVSVSAQRDTEHADLERERSELAADSDHEHDELTAIYVARGLDQALARQVAVQMMAHDALAAHARDELGINEFFSARPLQAAWTSALAFAAGALLPLLIVALAPSPWLLSATAAGSLASLAVLGVLSASTGGAAAGKAALRVTFWGALAMAATTVIGSLFGAVLA